jgi:D-serine deaminase-like pyridoxal phosphate-dependent protein
MLCCEGVAQQEDIAAKYYVTVVSTPSEEYAVIDGGTKTFPMDITLNTAPYFYPGYALVEGNDDLLLTRLNEEHGMLTSKKGRTGLKVGQKLALIPIHICTAINMQNDVYIYDGHELVKEKVNARGMIV